MVATKLMEQLVSHEGYCCLWACFHYNRKVRTAAFAKRYGVSRQTIKYWRKKYKRGQLKCLATSGCLTEVLDQFPRLASEANR